VIRHKIIKTHDDDDQKRWRAERSDGTRRTGERTKQLGRCGARGGVLRRRACTLSQQLVYHVHSDRNTDDRERIECSTQQINILFLFVQRVAIVIVVVTFVHLDLRNKTQITVAQRNQQKKIVDFTNNGNESMRGSKRRFVPAIVSIKRTSKTHTILFLPYRLVATTTNEFVNDY
jgi:hypothetical protein